MLFAIDSEAVYDLTVADNHVLQNAPNGGVRMHQVFGSAGIRDNDILMDNFGLLTYNTGGQNPLPLPLVDLLELYVRSRGDNQRFVPFQQIHATILGNRLRQELAGLAVPLSVHNLDHLNFTGNSISGPADGDISTALIFSISEGLLANNLVDGQVRLKVANVQRGIISGNVSPPNIPILLSSSPAVQLGLNEPQVVV